MDQLLMITGLSDKARGLEWLTRNWEERFGLQVTVQAFGWSGSKSTYEAKQAVLLEKVEELAKLGSLSVLGTSAGGHKAINLLAERPELVKSAVNVCGLSRIGSWEGSESHELFSHSLGILARQNFDVKKVMTFRPLFDELVPSDTVPVEGATNIQTRTIGHVPSIAWALTGRARTIADFVNSYTE